MTKADLRRSAQWLKIWAAALRDAEVVDGKWPATEDGRVSRDEYDDMRRLAEALYAEARAR